MKKYRVGIVGATGMVGQRFVSLLQNHPWFDITVLAASARSANKPYREAVAGRWAFDWAIPANVADLMVLDASQVETVCAQCDFVFCAVDMCKEDTRAMEDAYALCETPVVSSNSAHRHTSDVPMLLPEVNANHLEIITAQKARLGTKAGFIVVKPNCSIQPYVPALHALAAFIPEKVNVCTYQAISGAGKTFASWPEMVDNVIPFIGGEEEKSEKEPLRIWGHVQDGKIVPKQTPVISAQCIRVPCSDGHMAAISVSFAKKPTKEQILSAWANFSSLPQDLSLPSAPSQLLTYFEEENRPQTRLDRDLFGGMGIAIGRLREDTIFDYKFISLSHNTVRGAAGGSILTAELLCAKDYIPRK